MFDTPSLAISDDIYGSEKCPHKHEQTEVNNQLVCVWPVFENSENKKEIKNNFQKEKKAFEVSYFQYFQYLFITF